MGRSSKAVAERRRAVVRTLMARGMEQHEILDELSRGRYTMETIEKDGDIIPNPYYMSNPKTGKPVSKSTISRDWNHALDTWQEEAVKDVEEHFNRQLAEIQQGKRAAWAAKNLTEVRQFLALEIKLLGTARPEKIEHSVDEHLKGKVDAMSGLFQSMRKREG